jgi:hypothetical protein
MHSTASSEATRSKFKCFFITPILLLTIAQNASWVFSRFVNDWVTYSDNQHSSKILKNDSSARDNADELDDIPVWPVRAMQHYKLMHGNDVLRKESAGHMQHRKFSIVYYWCPDRAGNILHNMFNSIIWAIIANRTILVSFDDTGAPHNIKDECNNILSLLPWIPQWDEWSEILGLNNSIDFPIPIPIDSNREHFDRQHKTVIFPQIQDIRKRDSSIYRNEWRNDPMDQSDYQWVS